MCHLKSLVLRCRTGVEVNDSNTAHFHRYSLKKQIGARRFELPTSCSRSRRATKLRYAPYNSLRKRCVLSNNFSKDATLSFKLCLSSCGCYGANIEGVSDLLISCQTDTPNSYRLIKRPITKPCICWVLEKQMVRRTNRLIRVRKWTSTVVSSYYRPCMRRTGKVAVRR